MQITLGLVPQPLIIALSRDTSFVQALIAPEPWPDGIVIELRFSVGDYTTPTVWPATITDARAEWTHTDTDCAALIDAGKTRVRMVCTDSGGRELLWAKGRVSVV